MVEKLGNLVKGYIFELNFIYKVRLGCFRVVGFCLIK